MAEAATPEAETEAAAPAAEAAKRQGKKAKAATAATAEIAESFAALTSGLQLPEEGSRLGNAAVIGELFTGFLEQRKDELKAAQAEGGVAFSNAILRSTLQFLFGKLDGTVGELSVEAIQRDGGLAQHYNVLPVPGVYFKVDEVNRVYPNPRANKEDPNSPTAMKVEGRRVIELRVQVSDGVTTPGFLLEDGSFQAQEA